MIRVVPLGVVSTKQGPGHALLAVLSDGTIDLEVKESWAAAAAAMAGRHRGPFSCDPSLTTVARRHGWALMEQLDEELIKSRAAIALALYAQLPPGWGADVKALIDAWCAFFPMRLWEQMPAEMALPLVRRTRGRASQHVVAMLGQNGIEFGIAFYELPTDFDALWSGTSPRGSMISVLAEGEAPLLRTAFDALNVPAPIVCPAKAMRPRQPSRGDLKLMTAVMNLVAGLPRGVLAVALGPGDTLEFERTEKAAAPKKGTGKLKTKRLRPTAPPRGPR